MLFIDSKITHILALYSQRLLVIYWMSQFERYGHQNKPPPCTSPVASGFNVMRSTLRKQV